MQEENSLGGEYEGVVEGAHDTITSLAGVKMMQKYRGSIRKGTRYSIGEDQFSGQQRLEDLFLIEEDGKDDNTFDDLTEHTIRDDHAIKSSDSIGKRKEFSDCWNIATESMGAILYNFKGISKVRRNCNCY